MRKAKQLDALHRLHGIYLTALLDKPRHWSGTGADRVRAIQESERQFAAELRHAATMIQDARKALLASGFDAPDSWLTVRAVGDVGTSEQRLTPPGKSPSDQDEWKITLKYTGPDHAMLQQICDEISCAILRLENAPTANMSVAEAADALRLNRGHVTKLCADGTLTAEKDERGEWHIDRAAVEAYRPAPSKKRQYVTKAPMPAPATRTWYCLDCDGEDVQSQAKPTTPCPHCGHHRWVVRGLPSSK